MMYTDQSLSQEESKLHDPTSEESDDSTNEESDAYGGAYAVASMEVSDANILDKEELTTPAAPSNDVSFHSSDISFCFLQLYVSYFSVIVMRKAYSDK